MERGDWMRGLGLDFTNSVGTGGPYGYLLPNVYLFMAIIANPDLFVCVCRAWIVLTSPDFIRSSASHPAGPHGRLAPKRVN